MATTQGQTNHELEIRRQDALAAAHRCRQILKQDFGAEEVILFGSLRGDSPWHDRSDLDLAIRGLSSQDIGKAYLRLEKVVPPWLAFDLVDIDAVPDYIRAQILQEVAMPDNQYLALKARIEGEMKLITTTIEVIKEILPQANASPEILVIPALASYIADFYSGCERISERVAIVLDGQLPKGENWHQQLLAQLAEPGGHDRPPLWQGALLLQLNEYRSFRHVERHRYRIELQKDRVFALAADSIPVFEHIQAAVDQFNQWLEQQARSNE
jgi:predicted nucleotidyltransferase